MNDFAARRVLSSRRPSRTAISTLDKVGMNVKKRLLDGPRMNRAIRRMARSLIPDIGASKTRPSSRIGPIVIVGKTPKFWALVILPTV